MPQSANWGLTVNLLLLYSRGYHGQVLRSIMARVMRQSSPKGDDTFEKHGNAPSSKAGSNNIATARQEAWPIQHDKCQQDGNNSSVVIQSGAITVPL